MIRSVVGREAGKVRAHDCVVRRTNNLALCLRERKRHGRARVTTVDCHLDALHADQPLDPGDDRWSVLHDERVRVVVISIGIVLRLLGDAVEPRELDRPMPLRNLAGPATAAELVLAMHARLFVPCMQRVNTTKYSFLTPPSLFAIFHAIASCD